MVLIALRGANADYLAKSLDITLTSIRRWKAGQMINKKYWFKLSKALNLPVEEIENYCEKILNKQGRIKICKACGKRFIARFSRTRACGDICRKKLKPKFESKLKLEINFQKDFIDAMSKQETRDLIRSETIKFLNNGSKIQKLKPEEAYFTFDDLTWQNQ